MKATREKRFRPRSVRGDSTVTEADLKYPTDARSASSGMRALAWEGRKLTRLIGEKKAVVQDRSRSTAQAGQGARARQWTAAALQDMAARCENVARKSSSVWLRN